MNILFINYWGINDGLTQGASLPSIDTLNKNDKVEKIIFITIERNGKVTWDNSFVKVTHVPFYSVSWYFSILNKFDDYLSFPNKINQLCEEQKVDYIIARGASAGNLAYLVHRKNKLPFIVESFEPHADYMHDGGVWGKKSIKYGIQKKLESKQKKYAKGLVTVSSHYKNKLDLEGVKNVFVARCPVHYSFFDNLNIEKDRKNVTGIYVGKFGDIYYREEVIPLFESCYQYFDNFRLIIATPQNDDFIHRLRKEFPLAEINSFEHKEIPNLLAQASFGFATIRQSKIRKYCSPIKVGEYWALGLPVLLTKDVGDDADILKRTELGAVFDIKNQESVQKALNKIEALIDDSSVKIKIQELVYKYRSINDLSNAYNQIIFN